MSLVKLALTNSGEVWSETKWVCIKKIVVSGWGSSPPKCCCQEPVGYHSPDFTPLDFFLWGYLMAQVYKTVPRNIVDLQQRIRREIICDEENKDGAKGHGGHE